MHVDQSSKPLVTHVGLRHNLVKDKCLVQIASAKLDNRVSNPAMAAKTFYRVTTPTYGSLSPLVFQQVGRLVAWFGLDEGGLNTSVEELETHQSQAPTTPTTNRVERAASTTIACGPSHATSTDQLRQRRRVRTEVPPVRPREKIQRILQRKLSKNIGGACSSRFKVQDVD
nr:hypothetical protein [Tanacetum cinerariifolium]